MIKLKDVIHLYIGCQVRVSKKLEPGNELTGCIVEVSRRSNHGDWIAVAFDTAERVMYENFNERTSSMHNYFIGHDNIKPVLRPLSDMNDTECDEVGCDIHDGKYDKGTITSDCIVAGTYHVKSIRGSAEAIVWLLRNHFDIFGLIESGQAIDATKI